MYRWSINVSCELRAQLLAFVECSCLGEGCELPAKNASKMMSTVNNNFDPTLHCDMSFSTTLPNAVDFKRIMKIHRLN